MTTSTDMRRYGNIAELTERAGTLLDIMQKSQETNKSMVTWTKRMAIATGVMAFATMILVIITYLK